jgi:hypothetical protein
MAATKFDLTGTAKIEQGSSYKTRLYLSSATLDFTGSTSRGQIKKKYSDTAILAAFTATNGANPIDPDPAKRFWVDLTLTPTQTSAIPVDAASNYKKKSVLYCYDVEIELVGGTVIRLIEGTVEVTR